MSILASANARNDSTVIRVSAARSPAFGVITSTPPAITGSPGSGGQANRLAYASLPRKYRPLTKLKTSPSAAPLRLRRARATANCAFGDNTSCARRPEQFAGDKRKMRGECFGRRRAIVTRSTGGWRLPENTDREQRRREVADSGRQTKERSSTPSQQHGPDSKACPYCRHQ